VTHSGMGTPPLAALGVGKFVNVRCRSENTATRVLAWTRGSRATFPGRAPKIALEAKIGTKDIRGEIGYANRPSSGKQIKSQASIASNQFAMMRNAFDDAWRGPRGGMQEETAGAASRRDRGKLRTQRQKID